MVLILGATTFYHQHLCANATPYKMCTNGQQWIRVFTSPGFCVHA